MDSIEAKLLEALKGLAQAAQPRPAGSPRNEIGPKLAELDRLTNELPTGTDPELVHYLRRRSYEKARFFLEGRVAEIQKGGCLRSVSGS